MFVVAIMLCHGWGLSGTHCVPRQLYNDKKYETKEECNAVPVILYRHPNDGSFVQIRCMTEQEWENAIREKEPASPQGDEDRQRGPRAVQEGPA